jgi:uncharacterized LabA/DUF88 family protein
LDGQNLFHGVRDAFGFAYPNYDPRLLAEAVCEKNSGWVLGQARFYTGVPDPSDNPFWSHFWTAKLARMGREGVWTFSRPLRYQTTTQILPDGSETTHRRGHEKGIDVRIALDVVRLALDGEYDVGLIFSQDQDLSEVAEEVRQISRREGRWIKLASAFPVSATGRNRRGIARTDWIPIEHETYNRCLDSRDYRPKSS